MNQIGDIKQDRTALFVCDFQRYYDKKVSVYEYYVFNNLTLIKACEILNIPIIFTSHKGYGELEERLDKENKHKKFEKTKYSMWDSELSSYVKSTYPNLESIIITGFEMHVCLFQTVIDLKKEGYETHVVSDASASVSDIENKSAITRMKQMNTFFLTTEMLLLQLIRDDNHPNSKQIIELVEQKVAALSSDSFFTKN